MWCERAILWLVLAIVVIGPIATGAVHVFDFLVIQALTVLVTLVWAIRLWFSPRPKLLWPPICWPALAFALYAVARYFTSDIEYFARQELVRVIVYSFLFFAIVNNLHRQDPVEKIVLTLIFVAMAISFYAIYQFVTNSDQVWGYTKVYPHRGSGTYISPNHLGGFLEMLLPLALLYPLTSRISHLAKVFVGYAALVIAVGIAVTVSRGSWLATGSALLLLFAVLLTRRSYRVPALLMLAVLVIATVVLAPRVITLRLRAQELVLNDGRINDDARFALWQPAIKIWEQYFWWGSGPGHFNSHFRSFRPESVQKQPEWAHNDWLNTLADWGLVGGILVGSALLCLAIGMLRTWRSVRPGERQLGEPRGSNKFSFLLGAAVGLIALMLHSFVDFNMHIPANAILAIVLMAFLTSHLRFATDNYWLTARTWMKIVLTLLIICGGAFLVQQGWQRGNERIWLGKAEKSPIYSSEQVSLLTRAFEVEPKNPQTALRIGEALRIQSAVGNSDYRELGEKALVWFKRCQQLNPWEGYAFLRYGMCLDWLERVGESSPYFQKAEELDPNGYTTIQFIGQHYVATGDYAAAKPWFERSLRLQWQDNDIARNYLDLVNARLMESATNTYSFKKSGL